MVVTADEGGAEAVAGQADIRVTVAVDEAVVRLVDGELNDLSLGDFAGKKKLISIVPSLDTPTCATSTKVFNERLGGRDDVVVLVVSADLPFAQGRFCQAEGTADVKTLSMMRSRSLAAVSPWPRTSSNTMTSAHSTWSSQLSTFGTKPSPIWRSASSRM